MENRKGLAKTMADLLKGYVDETQIDKVILLVKNHALAAGAATGAAELVPGTAAAATVATVGFIWSMYYKICKEIGLDLSKTKLKAIASALVTNLAAYYAGSEAANIVLNLIPGLNLAGAALGAMLQFAMVYASGVLFIMILTRIFKAAGSIENANNLPEEEWTKCVQELSSDDVKNVAQKAKSEYKDVKNDPNTSAEGIEVMQD